jgi:peptide/nickel transport system permease protein
LTSRAAARILVAAPTLLGAAALVFLILRLIPGDPVANIMADYFTQASYEAIQHRLGLDRPLLLQFVTFIWDALHLRLGTSFQNQRDVLVNISEQLPYTAQLAAASLLLAIVLAVPAGVLSAVYRNKWPDLFSRILALVAISSPEFLLGTGLLLFFSLHLNWFPAYGVGVHGDWFSAMKSLVLPALTLGLREMGLLARLTRSMMLEVLSLDYVRTARAKGLRERVVVLRHGLRNALLPVITVVGIDLAYLLGGALVVETVFSRRGVGRVLLDAVLARDYPQIQGTLLVLITLAIVVNAFVDFVYVLVDPRIKYA